MPGPAPAVCRTSDSGAGEDQARRFTAHLTGAIARGDVQAFAAFYEAWFDRAHALARSISRRDEAFCLDVVQDSMMRVVRSMPALQTERAVQAWMARTLFTVTVDRIRQEHRRNRRERKAAEPEAAHSSVHPQESAEEREQLEWIRDRLAELPEEDRHLVLGRFREDKTLQALGESLGISTNAAHGRIWRIVQRLRRAAEGMFRD